MNSLSQLSNRIKGIWEGLQEREKIYIATGFILLALVLFYLILWEPIKTTNARLTKEVPILRGQHHEMLSISQSFQGSTGISRKPNLQTSIDRYFEDASKKHEITYTNLQFLAEKKIKTEIQNVEFNKLIRWLDDINKHTGITVTHANIELDKQPGFVTCRLELRKP